MPQISGIGCLKNFVNLSFSLHTPINLTPKHLFLFYLFFTQSSKLISSANHFLLSLFFTLRRTVLWLYLTWLPYFSSHSHFHCFTHNHFISITLWPSFVIKCLGISLHQITFFSVGFCRHFKSPHSFRCYHLIALCIFILYPLIFMWGNRIVS